MCLQILVVSYIIKIVCPKIVFFSDFIIFGDPDPAAFDVGDVPYWCSVAFFPPETRPGSKQ